MEIGDRLRSFIKQNFYAAHKLEIADSDSLLDRGIIDSTGVLELVGYLEKEFGIKIADEEMVPENLDSIANMLAFIQSKLGAS
jgi:acyl carrier protein